MNRAARICINGWAGRREYRCTVIGETKEKYRVRAIDTAYLPRGRVLEPGNTLLVPKYAVRIEG